MKLLVGIVLSAALALGASAADTKKKTTAAKSAPQPAGLTIPKDAIRTANGNYSYTDKDGVKWLYANTPFGVMRSPLTESAADPGTTPAAPATLQFTKAVDQGETV